MSNSGDGYWAHSGTIDCGKIKIYDIQNDRNNSPPFLKGGWVQVASKLTATSDGTVIVGTLNGVSGPTLSLHALTNRAGVNGLWRPLHLAADVMVIRPLLITRDDQHVILPYMAGLGKQPVSDLYLVEGGPDLWHPAAMERPRQLIPGIEPAAMVDSLDARVLYVADVRGKLHRIDLETFQVIEPSLDYPLTGGNAQVRANLTFMSMSPDGRHLVINRDVPMRQTTVRPTPAPTPSQTSPSPTDTPTEPPTSSTTPSLTPTPTATATATQTATSMPAALYLPLLLHEKCIPEIRRVDVVLAIDASSSMDEPAPAGGTKLAAALAAARGFLGELRFDRGDQAAIIAFNAEARLVMPLSSDRAALDAALTGIQTAQQTCIVCAVDAGWAELSSGRHVPDHAAVLVLLTDGRSNPRPASEAVARAAAAKAAGVVVFTIGLGADVEAEALAATASRPGWYYPAPDAGALVEIYRAIAVALPCPAGVFWGGR